MLVLSTFALWSTVDHIRARAFGASFFIAFGFLLVQTSGVAAIQLRTEDVWAIIGPGVGIVQITGCLLAIYGFVTGGRK